MKELLFYAQEREELRKKSEPVREFGSVLSQIVENMTWTMRTLAGNGLGISAIQTREPLRIGVLEMNYGHKKLGKPLVLCNPEVLDRNGKVLSNEGCLSFPGKFLPLNRPQIIRVKFQDVEGRERFSFFHEMFARCILHEMDHMDGVLFIDRFKEQFPNVDMTQKPLEWLNALDRT